MSAPITSILDSIVESEFAATLAKRGLDEARKLAEAAGVPLDTAHLVLVILENPVDYSAAAKYLDGVGYDLVYVRAEVEAMQPRPNVLMTPAFMNMLSTAADGVRARGSKALINVQQDLVMALMKNPGPALQRAVQAATDAALATHAQTT